MSIFDALVRDVASRFALGAKAGPFLQDLLRLIVETPGGIGGFLDKFRSVGLAGLTATWIAKAESTPISAPQLQSALGAGSIDALARKAGLAQQTAAPALAFLVPKVIDLLTPDGYVPNEVPRSVTAFLAESREGGSAPRRGGLAGWIWGLLGLAILALVALWASGVPGQKMVPTASQPAPSMPAKLSLSHDGDKIQFDGVVADDKTRTGVLASLQRVFGADRLAGDIAIDPKAAAAAWLANLEAALATLNVSGLEALFEGNTISLGGLLPAADLEAVKGKLQALFGSAFTVGSMADRAMSWFTDARARTLAALDALKPGFTGQDLVRALNLAVINFESGSAEISAESRDLLQKAASAIKQAPSGTRIDVGGHTDSTGDAPSNLTLSQQRAETVRITLVEMGVDPGMLQATGYGDARPVASNATPDGRFKNRRIEFVVIP